MYEEPAWAIPKYVNFISSSVGVVFKQQRPGGKKRLLNCRRLIYKEFCSVYLCINCYFVFAVNCLSKYTWFVS